MPFLLRIIIQRVLLFAYSVLAFLGIAPQIHIPTSAEIAAQEARKKAVAELMEKENIRREIHKDIGGIKIIVDEPTETEIPSTETPSPAEPITELQPPVTAPAVEPQRPPETIPETPAEKITPESSSANSIRDVVVNIICSYTDGNYVNVSTGSGVIISPNGVILTNSHVAQFFILESYDPDLIDCSIYKENIFTYGYKGEIVYASPKWISENYKLLSDGNARGTGEDDYALILITENTNPALDIPSIFPSAKIDTREISAGDSVVVAGYPGGPKSLSDLGHAGSLQTALVNIIEIFTFGGNYADVLTTSKSIVGAQGASGGGIFFGESEKTTNLVGIIATTDGTSGKSKINGITSSYIDRDIKKETGKSLSYYTNGDLESRVEEYKGTYVNYLAKLLLKEL